MRLCVQALCPREEALNMSKPHQEGCPSSGGVIDSVGHISELSHFCSGWLAYLPTPRVPWCLYRGLELSSGMMPGKSAAQPLPPTLTISLPDLLTGCQDMYRVLKSVSIRIFWGTCKKTKTKKPQTAQSCRPEFESPGPMQRPGRPGSLCDHNAW